MKCAHCYGNRRANFREFSIKISIKRRITNNQCPNFPSNTIEHCCFASNTARSVQIATFAIFKSKFKLNIVSTITVIQIPKVPSLSLSHQQSKTTFRAVLPSHVPEAGVTLFTLKKREREPNMKKLSCVMRKTLHHVIKLGVLRWSEAHKTKHTPRKTRDEKHADFSGVTRVEAIEQGAAVVWDFLRKYVEFSRVVQQKFQRHLEG